MEEKRIDTDTLALLTAFEDQKMLVINLENDPKIADYLQMVKNLKKLEDEVKDKIKSGLEIEWTQKFEFKKSYTKAYDVAKLFEIVGDETASRYAGEAEIAYPNFDKKAFEKDLKDKVLPFECSSIISNGQLRITISERKNTDFTL